MERGTGMDVEQAIRQRRSVGTFAEQPVPRALLAQLIEAATWAPNHHLTEPWRFTVVAGAAREEMASTLEAAAAAGDASAEGIARTARKKLLRAPAFVVVSQAVGENADATAALEDYAACCSATQNLLLAAHAAGLASKWSTGALATSAAAKSHLGLGPGDRIVGYVYLGYASGSDGRRAGEEASRRPAAIDWRGI